MTRWVNGVQLAKAAGFKHRSRIAQLKKNGIIRVGLEGKFDLEESLKNIQDARRNVSRVDKAENPTLPLDFPTTSKMNDEPDDNADPIPITAAPLNPYQADYYKNRAKIEEIKRKNLEYDFEEKQRKRAVTAPFYQAIRQLSMAINAKVKSKITAIPKKTALAWPDPKARPQLEAIINEQINEILTDISEIEPLEIEAEIFT